MKSLEVSRRLIKKLGSNIQLLITLRSNRAEMQANKYDVMRDIFSYVKDDLENLQCYTNKKCKSMEYVRELERTYWNAMIHSLEKYNITPKEEKKE